MKISTLFISLLFGILLCPVNLSAQKRASVIGTGTQRSDPATRGIQYEYTIVWAEDGNKVSTEQKKGIEWDVEGGTIVNTDTSKPSVNIIWDLNIAKGTVIAKNVIDLDEIITGEKLIYQSIFVKRDALEPEDPNYTGPLVYFNSFNTNPKQFDHIGLTIYEVCCGTPIYVEWNINGTISTSTSLNKTIYFPTTGNKNISAKVYFEEGRYLAIANVSVSVAPGNLNIGSIQGPSGTLGVGSSVSYHVKDYSTQDVSYTWSVRYRNTVTPLDETSSTAIITFDQEGTYTITCEGKDKRTGYTSTASKSVQISNEGGIMSIDDSIYEVSVENCGSLNVTTTENRDYSAYSLNNAANPMVIYKLYALNSGQLIKQGSLNNEGGTIDISSVRKGLYLLILQIGNHSESHKLIVN